jgi:hypothetical protein
MFRQAFGPPLLSRPVTDVFAGLEPASMKRSHDPFSMSDSAAGGST